MRADRSSSPPRLRGRVPFLGAPAALLTDAIEFQRRGHEALGPVFATSMFGLPLVFVGGHEAVTKIATSGDDELDLIGAYRKLLGRLLGEDLFLEIGGDVLRALSGSAVRRLSGPLCTLAAEDLRGRIGDGGEVDMLSVANGLVMRMACRYVCGDFLGIDRCDELARLFHLLESDFSVAGMLLPIETPSMRRRKAARDRILEIFEAEIRRALAEGPVDPDGYMRAVLDNAIADRSAPKPEEIHAAGLMLMGAVFGAHTNTAISLVACVADLLDHPEVLARVRNEVATVAGTKPLDLAVLCRMPLLLRAINESLRLHGNGGLWRMIRRPTEIAGHTLEAGTLVGTSMGLVNLDEATYRGSTTYDPDRYASMHVDDLQSPPVASRTFGAFGLGRHLCPGRRLAYTMLGAALAELLRAYDLVAVRRPRGWLTLMTAGVARPIGRFVVRATPR